MWNQLRALIGIELSAVTVREKLLSALGGIVSISMLMVVTQQALGTGAPAAAACLIASMGASAVLLFAVPHGQLSQPWPVLAGHGLSALIGVACQRYLSPAWLAGGLAVGLAILVMHQFKCIHPPGGATALTAVIGGPAVHDMGWDFVLFPVLTNACLMVLLAVLFNLLFAWRRYPTALAKRRGPEIPSVSPAHSQWLTPTHEDIIHALKSVDSFVDVTEEDLIALSVSLQQRMEQRKPRAVDVRSLQHQRHGEVSLLVKIP